MFDWIPIQYYSAIHYHFLLMVALLILLHAYQYDIRDRNSVQFFDAFGYLVVFILIIYMGLRQPSGVYFGDSSSYAKLFNAMQEGAEVQIKKDYMFNYFTKWCSSFMNRPSYFLFIDILYTIPCLLFSRKYFGKYWFFAMFMFIGSYSFWSAGTNGLRNGLGTSFFIMGLALYDKKYWMYLWFLAGYFMHASVIIPIVAFIVSGVYKNPKMYFYIWLAAIPLSLIGGSFWTGFFGGLGFEDRTAGYLTNSEGNLEQFSQTGFRWDFLLYSASGIAFGYYFIFKKNITDTFYIHLFGIYCIANAFWILVVTAAFSNRFAYLSWFLLAPVIAYPMFRFKIWENQYKKFGVILFLYFMFTYFMNVIK